MDKEFLQKVNIDLLQKETGKSLEELAALVHLKNPKNIYKWAKDQSEYGTRPSYNAIIQLLNAGATVETLFGVKYKNQKDVVNNKDSDANVESIVKRVLADIALAASSNK